MPRFFLLRPPRANPADPARPPSRPPPTLLSTVIHALETAYLAAFPILQAYVSNLHPLLSSRRASASGGGADEGGAFLPLMLVSTWCALGLGWSWLRLVWIGLEGGEWEGEVGRDDGAREGKKAL